MSHSYRSEFVLHEIENEGTHSNLRRPVINVDFDVDIEYLESPYFTTIWGQCYECRYGKFEENFHANFFSR